MRLISLILTYDLNKDIRYHNQCLSNNSYYKYKIPTCRVPALEQQLMYITLIEGRHDVYSIDNIRFAHGHLFDSRCYETLYNEHVLTILTTVF